MSSWTLWISGACTRHACKPLFENLPACTRKGDKFRVFPRLFDLNHRSLAAFPRNSALGGRSFGSQHEREARLSKPCRPGPATATATAEPSLTFRRSPRDASSLVAGRSRTFPQLLRLPHGTLPHFSSLPQEPSLTCRRSPTGRFLTCCGVRRRCGGWGARAGLGGRGASGRRSAICEGASGQLPQYVRERPVSCRSM